MSQTSIRAVSKVIKYLALIVFCAFCVLCIDYYYQLEDRAKTMEENLSITVFLAKNCKNSEKVSYDIESLNYVNIKEYVSSEESYLRAVEKNPFLKDISVPGDKDSFQAYYKVFPKHLPTNDNLVIIAKAVEGITDVDEVVFDYNAFARYLEAKNVTIFYKNVAMFFGVAILILFFFKSLFFILETPGNWKKLITNIFAYIIAASLGFIAAWSVCLYLQYPLLVNEMAAFFIIPFTVICAIIFKD